MFEQLITKDNKAILLDDFEDFLMIEVACGTPRLDTVKTYLTHVKLWVDWCTENNLIPANITERDMKRYRMKLIKDHLKPTSIAVKLSAIRQFYQAAIQWGLTDYNPVLNVKSPRNRESVEIRTKFLQRSQAEALLESVDTATLAGKRDLIVIAFMLLHGLRVSEVVNASVEDIISSPTGAIMRIKGKGIDNVIQLRKDVYTLIESFLKERSAVAKDILGTPLIISYSHSCKNKRMSRDAIRDIVEKYLKIIFTKEDPPEKTGEMAKIEEQTKEQINMPHLSCHALRHTFATLLYKKHHDLKLLQTELRHADLTNVLRYAHLCKDPDVFADDLLDLSIPKKAL